MRGGLRRMAERGCLEELPRVRYQWWSKSGGVAIKIFVTGGNVRLHEFLQIGRLALKAVTF